MIQTYLQAFRGFGDVQQQQLILIMFLLQHDDSVTCAGHGPIFWQEVIRTVGQLEQTGRGEEEGGDGQAGHLVQEEVRLERETDGFFT